MNMRNERGFTLIEVIMVMVVLAIVGTGILMYFAGLSGRPDAVTLTQSASLAQEKMERLLADKKANGFNTIVSEAASTLPAPFDRFTREVEVFCVQESDLGASNGTMPDCSDSDINAKRIRVTVSWGGGSSDFVTVMTNH